MIKDLVGADVFEDLIAAGMLILFCLIIFEAAQSAGEYQEERNKFLSKNKDKIQKLLNKPKNELSIEELEWLRINKIYNDSPPSWWISWRI